MSEKFSNDSDLVEELIKGDQAAFKMLFDHYASKLFNFSLYLTHNKEDAEEIVQETFLKVWENRQKVRADLSFNAYIITIAKNLIYNKIKRNALEHAITQYYQYTSKYIDNTTEETIVQADLEAVRNVIIHNLPERRKQILLLRKQGYNNDEVASMLNISKSTVANQINKTIKDLQKLFESKLITFVILLYFF